MVIDTSALLAYILDEPLAAWVDAKLQEHAGTLQMSTVNLTETLIVLRDRYPKSHRRMENQLQRVGIGWVPPTIEHASLAATARLRFPLNLGDCFAYALARASKDALLATDRDFKGIDVDVYLPP